MINNYFIMCGIVGVFKFDGSKVNEGELETLTTSLRHRGPDGSGIYLDKAKRIGLGHTRTSIFDISEAGNQPMSYSDERYWITFNGEIYNFIELRKELQSLGHIFKSDSDTEVVLAAYAQWGEQCQFKFNGDWAFAIWDNKEKNLFLSCDRFGTKPLYYIHHRNYFIFASELKAFMSLQSSSRPDFDYGFFLWLGKNRGCLNTFLKDVFLLPGGHQININQDNAFTLKKWWSTIDHLVEVPKTYEDQTAYFKELFFDACKIRLRSDVPIASCLSGGTDSSSIVSTIAKIRKDYPCIERYSEKTQNVFICEYIGDKNSETNFAKDVIFNKDIVPTYLDIDSSTITAEDLIKAQFDHEWIDTESIHASLLYKKMREKGIRASMDGNTPDETLGGYQSDLQIAIKEAVWPWSDKGRFEDLESIRKNITNNKIDQSKYKLIIKILLGEKNYDYIRLLSNKSAAIKSNEKNKYDLISKSELVYPQEDKIGKLDNFSSHLYRDFHYYKTPFNLQKFDKLSMAHGVLSRVPFIDPNLITYIFSLPSRAKIGGGYTKRILRDSMKNLVPDSVLHRKDKRGFTAPLNWFEKNMKHYILDSLNSTNFLKSDIFDGKKIRKDYENNYIQPHGNPSKAVLRYIQILKLINSFDQIATKTTT